jgi:hypothetical protein
MVVANIDEFIGLELPIFDPSHAFLNQVVVLLDDSFHFLVAVLVFFQTGVPGHFGTDFIALHLFPIMLDDFILVEDYVSFLVSQLSFVIVGLFGLGHL